MAISMPDHILRQGNLNGSSTKKGAVTVMDLFAMWRAGFKENRNMPCRTLVDLLGETANGVSGFGQEV